MAFLHVLLLLLSVYTTSAIARLVNVTVDDSNPIIQYAPAGGNQWTARTEDCDPLECSTRPDVTQVYNHTWHDATYDFFIKEQSAPQTLAIRFNGTAIYAYGILSTLASQCADMYMFIDNFYDPVANFKFNGSETEGSGSFIYNALLYSNTSLSPGEHSFLLQNGQGSGGLSSLILFDYLIYTTEVEDPVTTSSTAPTSTATPAPSSTSPSTSPTEAPIVASTTNPAPSPLLKVLPVIVAIVIVAAALFCFWWWRRQKRREAQALEAGQARPDPFPAPSSFVPAPGPSLGGGAPYGAQTFGQFGIGGQSVGDSVDTLGSEASKKALLLSPATAFDALPLYERGYGAAGSRTTSTSRLARSQTMKSTGTQLGPSPPAYSSEFGDQ